MGRLGELIAAILLVPVFAFAIYLFAIGGLALFISAGILFGAPPR